VAGAGDLGGARGGESALQLLDHRGQGLALLLLHARLAPKTGRSFRIAAGLGAGNALPESLDPVLDHSPVLMEQPQEVVGLSLIGLLGHGGGAVGLAGGPARGRQRGGDRRLPGMHRSGPVCAVGPVPKVTSAALG
jgi:hypothetical protein